MLADDVISQFPHPVELVPRGEILEGPEADVAGAEAQQCRGRLDLLALDRQVAPDDRERAGGGNAQPVHRLAAEVLADRRTQH